MTRPLRLNLLLILTLSLVGCSSMSNDAKPLAPEPVKAIDVAQFYTGRWYEIARTPMKLTDGCVAGTTDYLRDADGQLIDRDACRTDTPEGKEVVYRGPVTILDPGRNTKVEVHYRVWALFHVTYTYWFIDHADDYSWFIVTDPAFENVSLFTRSPRPSPQALDMLTARARQLGYDTRKLEFPTEFPPGEQ